MVNIKAKFSKDDRHNDGLQRVTEELAARPYERRIVVGVVRPVRTVINHEDGTRTPTVTFDNIEVLDGDTDAEKEAWELLSEAYEQRTGNPLSRSFFDGSTETLEQDTIPGTDEQD